MTTTTTTEQSATDVQDSQGLVKRMRERLPVAQVRGAVDQLLARVRSALDIPSRSEVAVLLDRIETLDAKLAALEKPKKVTAKKTAPKKSTANKTSRRKQIETAAKKRKPKPKR